MYKNKVVVSDGHIAYLAEMSNVRNDWADLFCDEEFMAMVMNHHRQAYRYLTKKYGKGK
jgi:hypothetical protein